MLCLPAGQARFAPNTLILNRFWQNLSSAAFYDPEFAFKALQKDMRHLRLTSTADLVAILALSCYP